jgi:predicted GNAT family acetyltransferase
LDNKKHGSFRYWIDGNEIGEMVIGIKDADLTVYHTEVKPEGEGKGYAKKLFEAMVAYARENNLKVIPLCAYIVALFKRHPDLYADIWKK